MNRLKEKSLEIYKIWTSAILPEALKSQLDELKEPQIIENFGVDLEFGTAGIRGIMGAGSNCINAITIMRANEAFIQFLNTKFSKTALAQRGVVIAHDNRHNSTYFAVLTAQILAKYNIKAWLMPNNELCPTPVLSYSIRQIQAVAGIVITASHNPPMYNGYKIYDHNGCQFLPNDTDVIAQIMNNLKWNFDLTFDFDQNLIEFVPESVITAYKKAILNLQFFPKSENRNLKIIFSNLHGTSLTVVPEILTTAGYEVIIVAEQADYDPDFKGVISPNPEVKETFDLAIQYGLKHKADLLILNDPDADRIGIGVWHNGAYQLLNGNETAPILLEYILSQKTNLKKMPQHPVMYNTFVSSNLSDLIAIRYGCTVIKTLTGFKWIGQEITKEPERNLQFIFAFEEAYGYVIEDITRDKDGIQAAMVVAEMTWYYLQQKQTLVDVLETIYQKYGYFYTYTVNLVLKGTEGAQKILAIMEKVRNTKIQQLNGVPITKIEDYLAGLYNMPGQNLIKIYLADGSWFAIRPSGTEPKIKFYFVCLGQSLQESKMKMQNYYRDFETLILELNERYEFND